MEAISKLQAAKSWRKAGSTSDGPKIFGAIVHNWGICAFLT